MHIKEWINEYPIHYYFYEMHQLLVGAEFSSFFYIFDYLKKRLLWRKNKQTYKQTNKQKKTI